MLAWVCLEGGLWWPGIILEPKSEVFVQQQQQQLKIVKCFGSEAELPVDLSKEDEVQILKNEDGLEENEFYDLHRGQAVKEELKQMFSNAMEELCKHLHLEKSAPALSIENQNTKTSKRLDAISWDDYFMAVAFLSAMRSKDPSTQVGACIVDPRKRIVGIGYNGFPTGCSDDVLPWSRRAEDELDTKYPYVVHAEVNAILNKISAELVNCTIYVGLFPCNECAKTIIQSGIAEVVFLCDKYAHTNSMKASRRMLNMAGVRLRQHNPKATSLLVNFDSINK